MKDSARRLVDGAMMAALAASALSAGGCARSDKTTDVAQDSILVKDADVAEHKTDTAGAATAALVRERGATPEAPALTSGAPVTRPADVSGSSAGTLQPPRRVNPSPVLPSREPTPIRRTDIVPAAPIPAQPTTTPPVPQPVTQPVSPQTPPVTQPAVPVTPPAQPIPASKKDSSRDSLSVRR
jgi:hypothetical protein